MIRALKIVIACVAMLLFSAFCVDRFGFEPQRRAIDREMARPFPKMTEQFAG
jgi:hypothetical protein